MDVLEKMCQECCDRKIRKRTKAKVFKSVVSPAIIYGGIKKALKN